MTITILPKKESREYVAPTVSIYEFETEQGFAGSGDHRPGHGWGDENHEHDGPGHGHGNGYFGRW